MRAILFLAACVVPFCYAVLCPAGQYDKAGVCTVCAKGTYNPVDNGVCLGTPAGYICATTGMTAPTICPAGYYSYANFSMCYGCPAGRYSPTAGRGGCIDCPIGTFSGAMNSVVCTPCAEGSYCAATGMSVCTPCFAD